MLGAASCFRTMYPSLRSSSAFAGLFYFHVMQTIKVQTYIAIYLMQKAITVEISILHSYICRYNKKKLMKKYGLAAVLSTVVLLCTMRAGAQGLSVNATGTAADSSAMLDVGSTTKGFLPPRMTTAQKDAIHNPATGLVVYQTDSTTGLYYNAGSPSSPGWQLVAPKVSLAYAYFYSTTTQILPGPFYVDITFNTTAVTNNVIFFSPATATILTSGVYRIAYGLQAYTSSGFTTTLAGMLMLDGTTVYPNFSVSIPSASAIPVSGERILTLTSGDYINLQCETSYSGTAITQAFLSITQIQ